MLRDQFRHRVVRDARHLPEEGIREGVRVDIDDHDCPRGAGQFCSIRLKPAAAAASDTTLLCNSISLANSSGLPGRTICPVAAIFPDISWSLAAAITSAAIRSRTSF